MTAIAQPAINTLLKMGNSGSPEVYNQIANVGDITGPGFAAAIVDVTSHSTSIPWRQKVTTLLDGGQLTCKLFFIPNDAGHKQLLRVYMNRGADGQAAGTPPQWSLTYPDPAATPVYFTAFISKFAITATVAGVIEAQVTFDVTGEPLIPGVNE